LIVYNYIEAYIKIEIYMKNIVRQRLKEIRKEYLYFNSVQSINAISDRFFTLLQELDLHGFNIRIIAGYYPTREEINLLPILHKALNLYYKICLPCVCVPNAPMIFRSWSEEDKMILNPMINILEPEPEQKMLMPDVIIVPLLGFDRKLMRLGYGAGYYDRTSEQYRSAIKIGIAYSIQEVPMITSEPHDLRLDAVVTENYVIQTLF
jgi:5-formyltetrahydrofolate cyclo-ligase